MGGGGGISTDRLRVYSHVYKVNLTFIVTLGITIPCFPTFEQTDLILCKETVASLSWGLDKVLLNFTGIISSTFLL